MSSALLALTELEKRPPCGCSQHCWTPTSGEAYICGNSIYEQPREIRRLVGYMPDFFGVYDDMKVIEYLEFFAATYRIPSGEAAEYLRKGARSSRPDVQARQHGKHTFTWTDPTSRTRSRAGP